MSDKSDKSSPKTYYESAADLSHLHGERVAVLGYGNLGRAYALNLHDNGVHVLIGNQQDEYADRARQDGFHVHSIQDAALEGSLLLMTMPDEAMPQIYLEQIAPYLKTGNMLVFASGFNIAYQFIEPPIFVDVGLLAPRTIAAKVREAFVKKERYPTAISLHHRATPNAAERLLAVAKAVGALEGGATETSFKQEVELDLFWQQAVMPALHSLLLTAATVLTRAGYPPRAALMELYLSGEMGEFFTHAAAQGFVDTMRGMSPMGQYGILSRTERFQESKLMLQMEQILDAIQEGKFAREWAGEFTDGYPRLNLLRQKLAQSTLWQLEERVLHEKSE